MQSVECCARLHLSLSAVCAVFVHVCFVRVAAADVLPHYPLQGLPALLIYRGGRCVANAIRLQDALPARFTDADVARLLQSQEVLSLPQGEDALQRMHQHTADEQQRRRDKRGAAGAHTRHAAASTTQGSEDEDD